MDDDYKKMLRSMDDLLRPHRAIQDNIERLMRPQLELQDYISRLLKPYDISKSFLDVLEEPTLKIQEEIQRSFNPAEIIRSQLEDFLRPQLEVQEQLEEVLRPQRLVEGQLSDLLKPQAAFIDTVKAQIESASLARDQIIDLIDPLNQYLTELQGSSIEVDEAGNLTIDGVEIEASEVSAVTSTLDGAQGNVCDFLHGLVAWLGQIAPRLRKAVLVLILPYLIAIVANLTTPLFQEWWRQKIVTDPRVAKKEIIQEAKEFYDPEELVDYRFVYATRLHVRAEGSMHAEIIDSVTLGKTVRVLRREKRWTQVEYVNASSGELCTGWMFSRYLRKFEK